MQLTTYTALAALVAVASAHGLVTKPATRAPGNATAAVCGETMVKFYQSDNTSYPEALIRAHGLDKDYDPIKCNLYLCKGFQFGDNAAAGGVQSYKPGDVVGLEVYIRIPHKGYANVSVVDTASNTVIGSPLIQWPDNYAATLDPPEDQTHFNITIPALGSTCTVPGRCVSRAEEGASMRSAQRLTATGYPMVLAGPGAADVRVMHRLYDADGHEFHGIELRQSDSAFYCLLHMGYPPGHTEQNNRANRQDINAAS